MRRWLVLVATLAVTGLCVATTIVLVPCSGEQFALRLERSWTIGRLKLRGGEIYRPSGGRWDLDLTTIAFQRMLVLGDHRQRILELEDVRWQRRELFPRGEQVAVHSGEVRFDRGTLEIESVVGSTWNFTPLLEGPGRWWRQLPAVVRGRELRLHAQRRSSTDPASLDVVLRDAEFRRDGARVYVKARLEDPGTPHRERHRNPPDPDTAAAWDHGRIQFEWPEDGTWSFQLIADVDLRHFPFENLRRLFGLPWPTGVVPRGGDASLDWNVTEDGSVLTVDHRRAVLPVPGLAHEVHALKGRAQLEQGRLRWDVDRAIYSHSQVSFRGLRIQSLPGGGTRMDQARVRLDDVLEDRDLGDDLPEPWGRLYHALELEGKSWLYLELAGDLASALRASAPERLVRAVDLHFEGVRLGASEGSLTGEIRIARDDDGWLVEGSTEAGLLLGMHVPQSRWRGRLDGGRIVLDRSNAAGGPRVHLEAGPTAVAGRRPLIGFKLSIRDVSLGRLLNLPLGDARAEVLLEGTWEEGGPEDGLTFTGIVRWDGMIPGDTIPWPVRAPRGAVSGDVVLVGDDGQLFVQWARARGPDGVWLATGHRSEQGRWVLDGALLEGEQYLPFPADVPARIWLASERFQIEGPLLRWSVERERGAQHRDEAREGPEPADGGDAAE